MLAVGFVAHPVHADGIAPLTIEEIAPGVFVHAGKHEIWHPDNHGDIANLSFVVGSSCVAVIDTGSTLAIGQRLLAAIRQVSDLPVCYVINTHAHPDHLLGNAAFANNESEPHTAFVAHANMARAQATRGQAYLQAVQRDLKATAAGTRLVAPTLTVDTSVELDLGNKQLTVTAHPTAHTDADLTIYDPDSQTLWLGDLAFVGHLPVVDGNLNGWIDLMERLARLPASIAIPGHGSWRHPGWPEMLAMQQDYLTRLRSSVRQAIANGDTLATTLATNKTGEQDGWHVYEQFHQRNVSAAFAELEWE